MTTTHIEIAVTSLRRMSVWYDKHPAPGHITPIEAIQCALRDTALAHEKAAQGLVWKAQNEWEPFNLPESTEDDSGNSLRKDIARVLNSHSAENGSSTPDFILAEYLTDCLAAFDKANQARFSWYAMGDTPPSPKA